MSFVHRSRDHKATKTRETESQPPANVQNVALDENVDGILAEIDDILEENAEQFVRGYVQKGGE